ncbi:hypothetical protein DKX38_025373 [Salix brachista]|uniref:Uncharacterized protein n=1 Tax=Salix brachista TaxID=2182728 RepID=A0A5N5JSL2_9ROSI|nr:hypothetical protein DKX38_025373 [Salix brachista]
MRIAHPARSLIPFTLNFSSPPLTKPLSSHSLTSNPAERPRRRVLQLSMAETENVSTTEIEDAAAKYGFTRSEMYKANLAGTVDPYDRHVFICFKNPDAWLPRVEEDDLPKLVSAAFKARKNDITVKTKVTICEAGEGSEFENGDVLIFPEMIKYKDLKDSDVNGFVDDVIVNGKPWASGVQEVFTGSHVFVCAHGSRDKRCGVCGPVLIEKLKEGIESRGLKDKVFVSACSHVGGHKYAGNLIAFSPDSEGKTMGHWYGYVTPEDVPEILDQHIEKGLVIERIWRFVFWHNTCIVDLNFLSRGQLGLSFEKGEKVGKQKLPNGKDKTKSKKHEETAAEAGKDNVASCCQGANGFSCCRDGSSEIIKEKKLEEKIEGHGKKGLDKLSRWIGSVGQSDVLAAVAVAGAIATIAVAYSVYKRSG